MNKSALERSMRNNKLLFHGSRYSNFSGIISRGLLPPKIITNQGGKRTDFGMLGMHFIIQISFNTNILKGAGNNRICIRNFVEIS
jgi:hypothetical protein